MPHTLIVGGSRGIGRVVAETFTAAGHDVSILARRLPERPLPERATVWPVDITNAEHLQDALNELLERRGGVNYVVVMQRWRGEGDDWAGEIATTLTATRNILDQVSDRFAAGDRAVAIVSSLIGHFVVANQPLSYHVGKGGLEALARHYAVVLGSRGIRVNAVAPSTVVKPEASAYYADNPALVEMFESIVPLRRMGTAADVAGVIGFLCSPSSGFMTGQILNVDGGMSLVLQEVIGRRLSGLS